MGISQDIEADTSAADHGRRILVVDDSRTQRRILGALLSRWGYNVVEAADGAAALALLSAEDFDFVLSDWMMPGMTGLELCHAYRDMRGTAMGYFILLTSKSEKEEVARGLDSGADDFLTKPVNADELLARIRAGDRILAMGASLADRNREVSAALEKIEALYEAVNRDLEDAKNLQHSLVPHHHHDFGTAEAALLLRSSGHVGGDLVGTFDAGGTEVGLFSIDVSGHGVGSALLTARLAAYLSAGNPAMNVALEPDGSGGFRARDPAIAAAMLDERMAVEIQTEHYFTLALAIADTATGRVRIAQAGHPHPAVARRDGRVRFVGSGGPPIGLVPGMEFGSFNLRLRPGERLLIHSDGFTECEDASGRMLGQPGLGRMVEDLNALSGREMLDALVARLEVFRGSDDFPDDLSAILFEYAGSAGRKAK